ncbi:hypothetical protein CDAR_600271 [Caerostris darwini]|uniref:Uncharacterized protein n=1 Tax=Caerostris darwini TaxID=1538125 RepID=A0AAV4SYB0_9ARAC|nr:hypothetical protein CDAR_600271 [Caerostris darwini]
MHAESGILEDADEDIGSLEWGVLNNRSQILQQVLMVFGHPILEQVRTHLPIFPGLYFQWHLSRRECTDCQDISCSKMHVKNGILEDADENIGSLKKVHCLDDYV